MKWITRTLLIAVIASGFAYHGDAKAIDFQAEIRADVGTEFTLVGSGIWWSAEHEHTIEQPKNGFSIGVIGEVHDWLKLRAGYRDMGSPLHIRSYALADDTRPERTRLSLFVSDGRVRGIYLAAQPSLHFGEVRTYVEIGLFCFKAEFEAMMIGMPVGFHSDGTPFGNENVSVKHDARFTIQPYLGFGMEYRNASLSINFYNLNGRETDQYTPSYKGAIVLEAGYAFNSSSI